MLNHMSQSGTEPRLIMRVDLQSDLPVDLRGGARVELARGEGAPHRGEPAVARADEGLPSVRARVRVRVRVRARVRVRVGVSVRVRVGGRVRARVGGRVRVRVRVRVGVRVRVRIRVSVS